MTDLSTSYLGLALRNPLVASASPLSQGVDRVRALADAGVGAVVMYSLFEEEVHRDQLHDLMVTETHENAFGEAQSYFPSTAAQGGSGPESGGADRYLRLLEQAAVSVDVPVIASLNGSTPGGWVGFARSMQDAGAAAVELNVYFVPGDPHTSGRDVEDRHVEILQQVKAAVTVPVAVKLSPHFSSMGEMAMRLDRAGADGLVLFNRFLQPDVDPEQLVVTTSTGLSAPAEARLPRTWIAILHGHVTASLAATTGVDQAEDVAAYLLAGADVVMTASALLRHGLGHAAVLLDGLDEWMRRKGFGTLDELRGRLAVPVGVDHDAYERAGYVAALQQLRRTYGDPLGARS
ncbi:dihydroorotate dehydrogenase-like protein [Knoellia locipacati]|uniref:dihydroorotate dehydrogenase-like protein n=1 Tax=Knoellia locipacati TaxID=882824 RepID=UPI00384C0EB2